MKKKNSVSMAVVNEHAAGIDVGSRQHYVAVGQEPQDVRTFNVYTKDHKALIEWLQQKGIVTVALESTGTYWQTLFSSLQAAGFEVVLSNNYIKDPQRKTDTKDARWLQKMHTLGLLKHSFIPSADVARLRSYHRHRSNIVAAATAHTQHMQKALRLMNLRLDVVLSDITGLSGTKIIEAILSGERSGESLSKLAHSRVKKSKQEIADSLQGDWKEEQLYILQDEWTMYKNCQQRIISCDQKIEALLKTMIHKTPPSSPYEAITTKPAKEKNKHSKNAPNFDAAALSRDYFGVDLLRIEGVASNTVLTFISEVGSDIYKFPTMKNFTSWLRLAPNNKKTGDKVFSSRTPKGKSIMANAFRVAANTVAQRKDGVLKKIFSRIAYKKGRSAAITAVARRLAEIFWIMTVKKQEYQPKNEQLYEEQIKKNVIKNIHKNIRKFGLTTEDILVVSN
jgi:transposase